MDEHPTIAVDIINIAKALAKFVFIFEHLWKSSIQPGSGASRPAELLLQTPECDPILARWTLGEGEADAFASDLARWTDGWRESNTGRRMLRQILAMGISAPVEEAEDISSEAPPAKKLRDLLLPLALLLLLVMLADIAIRRLRWKDVVMFFGRG